MAVVRKRHLIWLSGQKWDCVSGSDRSMAVALSEYIPVLWVDAPASPVAWPAAGGIPRLSISRARPKLSRLSDRMTRLTTVAPPGMTRPGVRATTPVITRAQIEWAMRKLSIDPAAVVMAYLGDLLGGWGDDVINVLYGSDDWVAGARLTGQSARNLLVRERRALTLADCVTAVTPRLAQRWSDLGVQAQVIPNGCWPDDGDVPPLPATLANLPRPCVGYVGYLGHRVDIDILISIAETGLPLLLVGAKDPHWEAERFQQLISRSNVRYVGSVPNSAVRAYMSAIDVGITPYGISEFNLASFPLKTLEYLGAGIPVVSSDLPASRWLREDLKTGTSESHADEVLMLAENSADFVSAVRRLIGSAADFRDARAKSCVSFAERYSWPRLAADFAAAIGISRDTDSDQNMQLDSARPYPQPEEHA